MKNPWQYVLVVAVVLVGSGTTPHRAVSAPRHSASTPGRPRYLTRRSIARTRSASTHGATNGTIRPAILVASTTDGRIVELNSATGRISRTLYRFPGTAPSSWTNWNPGEGAGLAVSPDASTLYFETGITFSKGTPTASIDRMSLRRPGTPSLVARGFLPTLSPNGTQLAYGTYSAGNNSYGPNRVVIDNLVNGTSRVVAVPAAPVGGNDVNITRMAWAPDNRHLALSMFAPGCRATALSIIDTAQRTSLQAPSGPTLRGATTNFYWWSPSYTGKGGLFLGRATYTPSCSATPSSESLVIVGPNSAHVFRVVATGPYGTLGGTAVDASGRHLLYIEETRNGPRLMVSDNGKTPIVLASNITFAVW